MKTETTKKRAVSTKSVAKTSATATISADTNSDSPKSKLVQTKPAATAVSSEQISERAYDRWLARGCVHGFHVEDWLEAEAQLQKEASV